MYAKAHRHASRFSPALPLLFFIDLQCYTTKKHTDTRRKPAQNNSRSTSADRSICTAQPCVSRETSLRCSRKKWQVNKRFKQTFILTDMLYMPTTNRTECHCFM